MIGPSIVLPALLAVVVGLVAGGLQRRLRPSLATFALTALAALAAGAVAAAVLVLAVLFVVQLPWVPAGFDWCRTVVSDHTLPGWAGIAALAATGGMVLSGLGALRHAGRRSARSAVELVILPSEEPTAYAVAGRPGHVVVSVGMLRVLDDDERRVLLAHERAHLRRGHHRYLAVAGVAASVVPLLSPLRDRVRFATERWADEDAAAEVGDRRLVARAICRAALAQQTGQPALALAGLGVAARVEALLDDTMRPTSRRQVPIVAMLAAVAVVGFSSTWQLHHVARLVEHICRLG